MGKEEVLRRVREAESQVQAMIQDAERQRDATLAKARRDADRSVEEGIASADRAAERSFNEARDAAKKESAARVEKGRRAIEADKVAAESRLPRAVDKLIEDFESTVSKG